MNDSELQKICNYPKNLRDSEIYSNKLFVKIDACSMGGTYWTVFYN